MWSMRDCGCCQRPTVGPGVAAIARLAPSTPGPSRAGHRLISSIFAMSSGSTICFGDVVKLRTTSGFADGATPSFLGFIEQGKSGQMLVVPPVKESVKSGLLEAEFIV